MIRCLRVFRPGLWTLVLLAMTTGASMASASSMIDVYIEVMAFEEHEELFMLTGEFYMPYVESEDWFDFDSVNEPYVSEPGANLEFGLISEGSYYRYEHEFDQSALNVDEIVDAFFMVAFTQEGTEEQTITNVRVGLIRWELGESIWSNEGVLSGDLEVGALDTTMIPVKVAANWGDLNLWGSSLVVAYRGGPSAAIPEPSGALLFSVGAGMVAFSMRRRSR